MWRVVSIFFFHPRDHLKIMYRMTIDWRYSPYYLCLIKLSNNTNERIKLNKKSTKKTLNIFDLGSSFV